MAHHDVDAMDDSMDDAMDDAMDDTAATDDDAANATNDVLDDAMDDWDDFPLSGPSLHHSQSPYNVTEPPRPLDTRAPVTIEEIEDEEAGARFPEKYPGNVAEVLGTGETMFETLQNRSEASGQSPWEPFQDQDEWELAEWLAKSVNKTATEEFLKLPIVS